VLEIGRVFDELARVARSGEVVSRVLDGEAVLLDLASGAYFGLNEVGTRFWDLLDRPRTLAEIRDALLLEFDVPRDALERDLGELVAALTKRGLISTASP
jgi:hypothetical protein